MESSDDAGNLRATPRRSMRLQNISEQSPVLLNSNKVQGPRQMAKLKKKLNQTAPEANTDPVSRVESPVELTQESSNAPEGSSQQAIGQVDFGKQKRRGKKGNASEAFQEPSEAELKSTVAGEVVDSIEKHSDTKEEPTGTQVKREIPKIVFTRPSLLTPEDNAVLKEDITVDATPTVEKSQTIESKSENNNKDKQSLSSSEIPKQPTVNESESSVHSSVSSEVSSERDQSTVIEAEKSVNSVQKAPRVEVEPTVTEVEKRSEEGSNVSSQIEKKSQEVITMKLENTVTGAEEKVSTAEETWEAQEPHSVTESSSGMSNEKFHTAGPSIQVVTPHQGSFLMDESIILVSDSPEPTNRLPKDSTFSPIVDTSINDSRPHIDPLAPLKIASLRTSTPLAQRVMHFTPGRSSRSVMKNLAAVSTVPVAETVAQNVFKPVSVLEKSILKSSRRKRSMSVADGESFMQKRVMFNSPQVMEINAIDEKMMASFIEEKENSVMMQAAHSGRRKRSLSTGTPFKVRAQSKVKVPNFRAIHEQQFEKMESIADHAFRKAERAKKLTTPTREIEAVRPKLQQLSKIPTMNSRKPLTSGPSTENLKKGSRLLKRSLSVNGEEPPRKKVQAVVAPVVSFPIQPIAEASKKVAAIRGLQRSNSESAKTNSAWIAPSTSNMFTIGTNKIPTKPSFGQSAAQSKAKIEERREKNISLYKTNQTQRSTADHRSKNANLLKGVRLNRRFELQMQHRRNTDDN